MGSMFQAVRRLVAILLRGKLGGAQKRGPFFDPSTRKPRATPVVLSAGERSELLEAVARAAHA